MAKVTKRELAEVLVKELGCNTNDAIFALDKMLNLIKKSVADGDGMEVRGFGSFSLVERKQKSVQDIGRKKTIIMPAWKYPKFKPSKYFLSLLNTKN